jgi:hypothetical protein
MSEYVQGLKLGDKLRGRVSYEGIVTFDKVYDVVDITEDGYGRIRDDFGELVYPLNILFFKEIK